MPDAVFDPYATLGLRPGADATQVREAYRRLARLHHPDRSGDRRATERMQAINRAWAMLSDPARRAGHDASRASARPSSAGHWSAGRTSQRTHWTPPPASWSTGAGAVPPYRSRESWAEDGPSWLGVLFTILLLVIIGPLLFVILPLPFSGLLLLLALGALTRGFER